MVRQGQTQAGLALLDEAAVAATSGALSPVVTGLTYCTAIAGCQLVYEFDRGREWTAALSSWCEAQPQLVPFAGRCLVHRAEILQLGGAWPEAIGEARQLAEQRLAVADPSALADAYYQEAEIHRLRRNRRGGGQLSAGERRRPRAAPGAGAPLARAGARRCRRRGAPIACSPRAKSAGRERVICPRRSRLGLRARPRPRRRPPAGSWKASRVDLGPTCWPPSRRSLAQRSSWRARGLKTPWDRRARPFASWQQLSAPYPAARARVLLGRACRALGDAETARIEEELAREVFARLGAAPDLAALDEPPPRRRPPPARPAG